MADGALEHDMKPTEELSVRDVFGLRSVVIDDPISATPLVIPADQRQDGRSDDH